MNAGRAAENPIGPLTVSKLGRGKRGQSSGSDM